MTYEPLIGNQLVFDFVKLVGVKGDGLTIIFDFGVVDDGGTEETVVQPSTGISGKIGWKSARRCDGGSIKCGWMSFLNKDRLIRSGFASSKDKLAVSLSSPWNMTKACDRSFSSKWNECVATDGDELNAPWNNPRKKDKSFISSWKTAKPVDILLSSLWINRLKTLDISSRIPWKKINRKDGSFTFPWVNSMKTIDKSHRTYWGKQLFEEVCKKKYQYPVGNQLILDFTTNINKVDDGDNITFYFHDETYSIRCTQDEPTGARDPFLYIYATKSAERITPKYRVYFIMNSFSLIRTSDSQQIKCTSINIKQDIDSWCWSFNATIPASALPLVNPVSEPVEILATINGHSWLLMVESWRENLSFGKGQYTISGRSTSAELAAPYAPLITGVYDEGMLNTAICEDQLSNTGWDMDWDNYENTWIITANALSFNNSSALKVCQSIAEAVGGRLQTAPNEAKITVVPRLHSLPWEWSDTTADLAISDYVVKQLSREFMPGLSYDAVFVSGTTQGVLCKITREGFAGDNIAPMVTDALMTDVYPATERGRMIIGQSGNWSRETLELPLTASGDLPGLLETGMLVSMTEGTEEWKGQVSSIEVSAGWEARAGLKVRQSVGVERYRGQ